MRVFCSSPNCSESVSGVRFTPGEQGGVKGMVSADISDEEGARFLTIPGYEAYTGKQEATSKPSSPPAGGDGGEQADGNQTASGSESPEGGNKEKAAGDGNPDSDKEKDKSKGSKKGSDKT